MKNLTLLLFTLMSYVSYSKGLEYEKPTFQDALPGLIFFLVLFGLIAALIIWAKKSIKKENIKKEQERLHKEQVLKNFKHEGLMTLEDFNIKNYPKYTNIIDAIKNANSVDEVKIYLNKTLHSLMLLDKYGEDIGEKLINQEYFLGMTIEQLIDCKGNPTKIEKEVLKTKTNEMYIYGTKNSGDVFVFVNGVLDRFKDR